jgi:hypothetical protein
MRPTASRISASRWGHGCATQLFELLGSRDKQLIAFPGTHRTAAPAAIKAWCEFVTHHLEG